jgi:2-haloacid dehalogenase
MPSNPIEQVDTLAFDIFGTVLDLATNILPAVREILQAKGSTADPNAVWAQWRDRQRIEQYQDTILMLGHGGYLEVARRALSYTLRQNRIPFDDAETREWIRVFERLRPYEDAVEGLRRLKQRYRLIALSNGDEWLLKHLVENNIPVEFDGIFSVDRVGRFKPHPSVYRAAARQLGRDPGQIMMVASHAFDVLGARACGFRGAYVNRHGLPYEEWELQPDYVAGDFIELAGKIA